LLAAWLKARSGIAKARSLLWLRRGFRSPEAADFRGIIREDPVRRIYPT
jgi:hypothetical protein